MTATYTFRTAFVTGGSGFVGRNLITALRTQGIEVRALARSNSAIETVTRLGAQPVQGDLRNTDILASAMNGCDVVFHVAGQVGDWGRYEDFYQTNVVGTENVLEAARKAGVPRLVHVSTEAVLLGGPAIVNVDETRPRPQHPLGMYGRTKGLAEERVLNANSPELSTVIVRPRFIWGKGDTTVLAQLVQTVRSGSFMWINGGYYLTSICHVANVCEGMMLAAERGQGGEIAFSMCYITSRQLYIIGVLTTWFSTSRHFVQGKLVMLMLYAMSPILTFTKLLTIFSIPSSPSSRV